MDDLGQILDNLSAEELAYVYERSTTHKDATAYKAAGISKSTFYERYDETRRDELNDLAFQIRKERTLLANRELIAKAQDAAQVLTKLLTDENPNVKLKAATEILDRTMGKPTQKTELFGESGGPVQIEVVYKNRDQRNGTSATEDTP